jgi:pyrimidine-specific ribonucleoside hydrolase
MTTQTKLNQKRKILIDCDTGTDDAIAIVAALYSPDMELVALTTVDGNVALEYTSRNTLNLVHYLGFNTPVAVGAASQLKHHVTHKPSGTHGMQGLGSVYLPEMNAQFYQKNAIDTIYDEAMKAHGELEIVAIGPLTNIAIAFMMYPELKTMIKHLYIMGGAAFGGNIHTTAEFNIWKDPEAGRIVFASGVPCTMVGLDVTEQAILDESDAEKCRALKSPAGDFVADILDFMFVRRDSGGEDALMHDALALAAALAPECLHCEQYFVDVECEGTYTFGHTYVDVYNRLKREPNVNVAMGLDLEAFRTWLHACLEHSR